MKKIYFAGPLFSAGEKEFNQKICRALEEAGYEVFLPQRDGILAADTENKSDDELVRMIFSKDSAEIAESDMLIFVTDGRVPDEGACVELGMAYAMGKPCYGIRTDARTLENGLPLNPLIAGCFEKVFSDDDADRLVSSIKAYFRSSVQNNE